MANRFFSPNQQFADSTGLPYANGTLAFYASGTSTPLATYSDSALTIANTNPVVLDSAGRAGNIFLQNLAYKVVLSDVNSNVIWTDDPVYSSDYSTRAKLLSGAGSPNGNTAGTQGSTGIGADTYWDTTNNILYVCTQTGTTSTAVWTAVNASSATAVVVTPQGYLTLASDASNPILTTDAVSATSVFYTPYTGNQVPIYNGSSFVITTFSQLTLTLNASQALSTLYDVFIFNNSGVLTLATGPAWSTSAFASGARGTGAGTTQLSRLNGIWVNTVQISGKNGANTYTIPANTAIYLGSIYMDTSAGQVSCYRTYGQNRKWGVWNAYNRQNLSVKAGDATASWTVGGGGAGGVRVLNNNNANSIIVMQGLPEEFYDCTFYMRQSGTATTNQTLQPINAIGFNSTSSGSGVFGTCQHSYGSGVVGNLSSLDALTARYDNTSFSPMIGTQQVYALEGYSNVGAAAPTATGGETSNVLIVSWKG
jgi:hypothetical protein